MARRFNKIDDDYLRIRTEEQGSVPCDWLTPCFVSVWFKVSTASGFSRIYCHNVGADNQRRQIYLDGTTCYIQHKGYNAAGLFIAMGTITLNQWHHAWGWFDEGIRFRGALDNGSIVGSTANTGNYNAYTRMNIGNRDSGYECLDGDIGEVGMWDQELTADQITALFNGAPPSDVRPEDCVGHWPMWGAYDAAGFGAIEQNLIGNPLHYLQQNVNAPANNPQSPGPPVGSSFDLGSVSFATISAQTINLSGNGIVSAESFGSHSIIQMIEPIGIVSQEAIGNHQLNLHIYTTGIVSNESFGLHTISREQEIVPEEIESLESFGVIIVSRGAFNLNAFSIPTEETFGNAELIRELIDLTPNSIDSHETFGNTNISYVIKPNGIISGETFGTQIVLAGNINVIPTAISSGETFGNHILSTGNINIEPIGINSQESFGNTTLLFGNIDLIPTSVLSEESFNNPSIIPGSVDISFTGIASNETFGGTIIVSGAVDISPNGIIGKESFGDFNTIPGTVNIDGAGKIVSNEIFGDINVLPGSVDISFDSINSLENFGLHEILRGPVDISLTGISSVEAFGSINVNYILYANSIDSVENFGDLSISVGPVDINVTSINSQEIVNDAIVRNLWVLVIPSIDSQEGFGNHVLTHFVWNELRNCMEDDLNNIYDELDEFSEQGYVYHTNGLSYAIPIVFDNEYTEMNTDAQAIIQSRQPMIRVKDRFQKRPMRNDKFIVRDTNYMILTYEPDGTGEAILTLQHERTNRP